jgi:hypothetical protein
VVLRHTSNNSVISSICRGDRFGRVSLRLSLFLMNCNALLAGTLGKRLTTSKPTKMSVPYTLNFSSISIKCLEFIINDSV